MHFTVLGRCRCIRSAVPQQRGSGGTALAPPDWQFADCLAISVHFEASEWRRLKFQSVRWISVHVFRFRRLHCLWNRSCLKLFKLPNNKKTTKRTVRFLFTLEGCFLIQLNYLCPAQLYCFLVAKFGDRARWPAGPTHDWFFRPSLIRHPLNIRKNSMLTCVTLRSITPTFRYLNQLFLLSKVSSCKLLSIFFWFSVQL